jgi:RNA-splicing ligase RtcB
MFEIKGKYNNCKVFTDNCDNETISQLTNLLNQQSTEGSNIRIMPDCHAGKGCVIGTTMKLTDKVIPNLVGVDIGCGMLAVKLKEKRINLPELDSIIRKYVPSGGNVHDYTNEDRTSLIVDNLRCCGKAQIRAELAYKSVGTLGGGNHFIEVDKDSNDNLWLVIHTGSRHLGIEICNYYQDVAYNKIKSKENNGSLQDKRKQLIEQLKSEGRQKDISKELEKFSKEYIELNPSVPFELAYVEGEDFEDYIHDMKLVQNHAICNRAEIARVILKNAKLHEVERFETIHNYIDTENMILRKGSISAQQGEKVLIPMNMRDGSLICVGKGNSDWNYSAPHGAGRIMSRSKAKENISVADFKKTMKDAGIFSTSVGKGTIDESPMAYKPMEEIMENIKDTVDIIDVIKPIYNFKAGEE